ncbi:MAG TPA: GNAT family N-acetyltransferase [Verrucomicrobiae bacterium]
MPSRFEKTNQARLKRATSKDLSLLMGFVREYYTFDQIPFHEVELRQGLTLLLNEQRLGGAWLVLHQKRPVGYIVVTFGFDPEFGGRQATVTEFYLQPEHRGKGLARIALEHVEEFVSRRGVQVLDLQVTRGNSRAYDFYKRYGFQPHDRIPMSKRLEVRTLARPARRRQGRKLGAS